MLSTNTSISVMPLGGRGRARVGDLTFFLKIFVKIHSLGTKSLVKKHKNPHPGANLSIVVKYSTCTMQD